MRNFHLKKATWKCKKGSCKAEDRITNVGATKARLNLVCSKKVSIFDQSVQTKI